METQEQNETAIQPHRGDGAPQEAQMQAPARFDAYGIEEIKRQVSLVQEVQKSVMQEGTHFGTIPGTNKPTLYKAGAEKLNLTFRLSPQYEVERTDFSPTEERPEGHREYTVHCKLIHIPTGDLWGEGVGSCSTLESKYRYRTAQLSCPQCGQETVIKGKEEYGGGWLCWKKKGGCGATWDDGASAIEDQERGKVENPDIADVYNTVLKMAKKRAHVDAVLTCTAASDIFTQDLEDLAGSRSKQGRPQRGGQRQKQEPEVQGQRRSRPQREEPKRSQPESSGTTSDEKRDDHNKVMKRVQELGREMYGDAWQERWKQIQDKYQRKNLTTEQLEATHRALLQRREEWENEDAGEGDEEPSNAESMSSVMDEENVPQ